MSKNDIKAKSEIFIDMMLEKLEKIALLDRV